MNPPNINTQPTQSNPLKQPTQPTPIIQTANPIQLTKLISLSSLNIMSYMPFLVIILVVAFGIYQIFLASADTKADSDTMAYYTVVIVLSVIIALLFIVYKTIGQSLFFPMIIFVLIVVLFFGVLYALIYTGLSKYIFNRYLLYVLDAAIILVGLSIVYNVFSGNLKRMKKTWFSFILHFILYIPCLISDGVAYLMKDYQSTPVSAFILLVIEIFLLLVYFYLYPLTMQHFTGEYTVLLKEPVLLSSQTMMGEDFFQNYKNRSITPPTITALGITGTDPQHSPYATNYSISMWTYMNAMPSSKMSYSIGKSTTIFSYSSMRPTLMHEVDSEGNSVYTAHFSESIKHSFTMPYQKWNYLVFNYKESNIDLFVNGVLEYSHEFGKDALTFGAPDEMYTGDPSEKMSGLYGSICNITYYPRPMTGPEIITTYNLMSIHNPPV